jgi:hypothetical protein
MPNTLANSSQSDTAIATPATVPYERFAASQRTIAGLLAERASLMEVLTELVNASEPYRHLVIRLAGQPDIATAHAVALAWCRQWEAAQRRAPAMPATPPSPANQTQQLPTVPGQ